MPKKVKNYGCTLFYSSEQPVLVPAEIAREINHMINIGVAQPDDLDHLIGMLQMAAFLAPDPVTAVLRIAASEWLIDNATEFVNHWNGGLVPLNLS